MKHLFVLSFLLTMSSAHALVPNSEFKVTSTLGEIISYQQVGKDLEINGMGSEFSYADLTEKELDGLKSLMKTKQEYGKMFGFAEWKSTGMKLVEKNGERIALIEGQYRDSDKKIVNFVEVYWANHQKSGQYLITSNSTVLKMDNYSDYLK